MEVQKIRDEFKNEILRKVRFLDRTHELLGDNDTYKQTWKIIRCELDGIIGIADNLGIFTDEELEEFYNMYL